MSKSQIKRLHQQQELEKAAAVVNQEDEDVEPVVVQRKGPANRFAFFDEEDDVASDKSEEADGVDNNGPSTSDAKASKNKKKKNKKKEKKAKQEHEETENEMLARLANLNMQEKQLAATEDAEPPLLSELLKVEIKMFDIFGELKRKLGKTFKDVVIDENDENKWPPGKRATGRILKNKPRWWPDKSNGLSMEIVQPDRNKSSSMNTWFKITHNSDYGERERMFLLAEAGHNVEIIQDIFASSPYHLNCLLMMGHMSRMNDDLNTGADFIERGIWFVDQHSHPTFSPFNWTHRMSYLDFENRAFYLLLHRHMLNAAGKRCFETAFNTGKLIFKLDPSHDALAMLSIIDTYALRAKLYTWIEQFYSAACDLKNLDSLPNWQYSKALAKFFLAKTDEEMDQARKLLCEAIRKFPSVVAALLDLLQIHPDSAVMNCKFLTAASAEREPDSLKILVKIYAKQTEEIWKDPAVLLFLEQSAQAVAATQSLSERLELEDWAERRPKYYSGRSPNVERLAQLLEVLPTASISNPVPPKNGRTPYKKLYVPNVPIRPDQSLVAGLLQSIAPYFDGEETFYNQLARYGNEFSQFLSHRFLARAPVDPEEVAIEWAGRREELDEARREARRRQRQQEAGEIIHLDSDAEEPRGNQDGQSN
ncbi:hypothetical protein L5515_000449 [Caenorhabditis briggsae]|uniref:Uncharacterized protein n=1 Tax=Caenorhabditis briggsae TaxID=6238 RepID=A0AAE9E1T6_CAEBR|nr:hypothetical protein L5515_000449 [Caenorhabditis briggsae]